MSRREFSKQTKRDALFELTARCGVRRASINWKIRLRPHHSGCARGEPTLDNCRVACKALPRGETGKRDIPAIAKTKRIRDRERPEAIQRLDSKKFKMRIGGGLVDRRTGQPAKFNRGVRNDGHTDRT